MVNSLSIEDMKEAARLRGGWCLSEIYINQLTKLTWKCAEDHIWEALPKHVRKGSWCPVCARKRENRIKRPDLNIESMKIISEKLGGVCLSDRYVNKSTKLRFKCEKGHEFETRPAEIQRGSWCPYCSGKYGNSIEKMHKIAQERGGKCLSTSYINVFTHLSWECANGHQFNAIPKHVINGHWCPNCTIYLNEQLCRYILETLFDVKFIKDRTVLNGFELDGYNPDLKLAFEYHGKQHYEEIDFFYSRGDMNLHDRMHRDKLKEQMCKELGITLLIIPYTVEYKALVFYIAEELADKGFQFKLSPKDINYDNYYPTKQELVEILEIAKDKGGECLSTVYINVDSKMEFICNRGHFFESTPYLIRKGQWCKKCFYLDKAGASQRLDKNEMHKIAEQKNWECLSTEYKNARAKLIWRCEKGHIFERSLSHVKEGRGCPICNKKNNKANYFIQETLWE